MSYHRPCQGIITQQFFFKQLYNCSSVMFIWITISRQIIKKSFFSHMCDGFVLHQKRTFSLNHNMNSGLFSLHHYVTNQCIWLVQRTSPLLFFSSKPFTLLLSHHFIYARYMAPVSFPPASLFLLILCHLPPSSFSAICLHSVCASRKFPLRLWGNCVFLCSARLSFFSCMFSVLAKLPLPACSRECAPSAAVP